MNNDHERSNEALIDDIIKLLDQSVTKGTGHLNISVTGAASDPKKPLNKSVETLGCTDCAAGDLACNIPTLLNGIDDRSEELESPTKTNYKKSGGKNHE